MTGKELILVLAGCGVAAGAVGVTTAMVGSQPPADDRSAEILERLDDLGSSMEKNRKAAERVERQVEHLADRVTAVERRTATIEQSAPAPVVGGLSAGDAAMDSDAVREALARHGVHRLRTTSDGEVVFPAPGELAQHVEKLKAGALEGLDGNLAEHLEQALGELGDVEIEGVPIGGMLGGFRKGLQLRRLPEAERWDKARDEIGLADYQVDSLKQAIADRDAAMKDAMITDTRTTDGGAMLTFSRVDHEKARAARQDYDRRIAETLNDQQRKDWKAGGYDNAFGGAGPMGIGSGMVITSTSTSPGSHDVETIEIGGE